MPFAVTDQSFDRRARGWDCPRCPATADEQCVTPAGRRTHSHHARVRLVKAYDSGVRAPSFAAWPVLKVACPACGVGQNELCLTTHGRPRPASYPHEARVTQLAKIMDGPHVRMAGTTAHVYLPAGTDHIIIGYLEK